MKPILFNTEMVQAMLEGRKTVTRRVVKFKAGQNPAWTGYIPDGAVLYGSNNIPAAKAPYHPGDILWVRETWCGMCLDCEECTRKGYIYKADGPYYKSCPYEIEWRPSIHMPKEAARLFLRITGVRVERLQDIDNTGARAEGCDGRCSGPHDGENSDWQKEYDFSVERFEAVWDSTIKPNRLPRYGWAANPWVWVIEFERISKEAAIGGGGDG